MFGNKVQTIKVEGMMCEHCAAHVKAALEKVEGVKGVSVDLKAKRASVKSKEGIEEALLEKAVVDAGYKFAGSVE